MVSARRGKGAAGGRARAAIKDPTPQCDSPGRLRARWAKKKGGTLMKIERWWERDPQTCSWTYEQLAAVRLAAERWDVEGVKQKWAPDKSPVQIAGRI